MLCFVCVGGEDLHDGVHCGQTSAGQEGADGSLGLTAQPN